MKLKNILVYSICLLTVLTSMILLNGCNSASESKDNLGYNFQPYDEQAFAEQMAKTGENKIAFASNGESDYSTIVYPDGLFNGDTDRDTLELEGAIEYLRYALTAVTSAQFNIIPRSDYDSGKAFILAVDDGCGAKNRSFLRLFINTAYSSVHSLSYSSSLTLSSHSFVAPSEGISMAICVNHPSFVAPCQCLTSGAIYTTSPGESRRGVAPSSTYHPSPSVHKSICPPL